MAFQTAFSSFIFSPFFFFIFPLLFLWNRLHRTITCVYVRIYVHTQSDLFSDLLVESIIVNSGVYYGKCTLLIAHFNCNRYPLTFSICRNWVIY